MWLTSLAFLAAKKPSVRTMGTSIDTCLLASAPGQGRRGPSTHTQIQQTRAKTHCANTDPQVLAALTLPGTGRPLVRTQHQ